MHFLSSIEIHLLKMAISKYERGNGAKNVNGFYFRKWNFFKDFPAE